MQCLKPFIRRNSLKPVISILDMFQFRLQPFRKKRKLPYVFGAGLALGCSNEQELRRKKGRLTGTTGLEPDRREHLE